MNRRALLALAAALPFAGAARAQTAAGRLILHEAVTSAHVKARNVSVWLPPGYEASDAAYPVLYMHDGQNLFDPSTANFGEWGVDEHLTRLIAGGQVRAPIVVGVWNTDLRLREYVPADLIAALPGQVLFDRSDDLLNPTKGFRLKLNLSPETSVRGAARPSKGRACAAACACAPAGACRGSCVETEQAQQSRGSRASEDTD